jgi:nucleoside-diphosphate-sugar epimerase
MKILVTGATGFIGRRLVPLLLAQGHEVCATVRASSDLNRLPSGVRQIGVEACLSLPEDALSDVDLVIHLAARAHILNDQACDPEAEFFQVNAQMTANLVQAAIVSGVKQFIFISSIGAMSTLNDAVLTEQTPCRPDTPYGRSKLQAEESLIALASQSPMKWTILRPTLVYGSGNPGNMERLLKLINRRLPLPLGAISNRRSFIYVENLADVIVRSIAHPNAMNQLFLVSDGEDLSTSDLIRRLAASLDCSVPLVSVPPKLIRIAGRLTGKTDAIHRLLGSLAVDSGKVRKSLNWQPPYTVDQGLKATAEWFKASSSSLYR